jgi:transposase InsO family protein
MTAVSKALKVSRSVLYSRKKKKPPALPGPYRKAADQQLLPLIIELVHQRPSYGYRRIHALLNRKCNGQAVNHKRVYRIMKQNGLLLARHSGRRPERAHEGSVITLRSNMRWCSDEFEIACWNGQRVRVAFSLDCCDRELISYVATSGAINAEMVRDLMVQSIEYRFGSVDKAPHPIEWLSDNGSCYTAHKTRQFAKELGLICCTTPVSSPQSNGMAEAFIKTFKRDYVYIHDRPDAKTVMVMLSRWFEDYNEVHPHKGLKMKSPREFIRSYST